eukprot:6461448-Amphidinium_carterae.1
MERSIKAVGSHSSNGVACFFRCFEYQHDKLQTLRCAVPTLICVDALLTTVCLCSAKYLIRPSFEGVLASLVRNDRDVSTLAAVVCGTLDVKNANLGQMGQRAKGGVQIIATHTRTGKDEYS